MQPHSNPEPFVHWCSCLLQILLTSRPKCDHKVINCLFDPTFLSTWVPHPSQINQCPESLLRHPIPNAMLTFWCCAKPCQIFVFLGTKPSLQLEFSIVLTNYSDFLLQIQPTGQPSLVFFIPSPQYFTNTNLVLKLLPYFKKQMVFLIKQLKCKTFGF